MKELIGADASRVEPQDAETLQASAVQRTEVIKLVDSLLERAKNDPAALKSILNRLRAIEPSDPLDPMKNMSEVEVLSSVGRISGFVATNYRDEIQIVDRYRRTSGYEVGRQFQGLSENCQNTISGEAYCSALPRLRAILGLVQDEKILLGPVVKLNLESAYKRLTQLAFPGTG